MYVISAECCDLIYIYIYIHPGYIEQGPDGAATILRRAVLGGHGVPAEVGGCLVFSLPSCLFQGGGYSTTLRTACGAPDEVAS